MSYSALAAAAPIAGVESRNEKRAADSRVILRNSPAEMVTPLRDVPGTTANACAAPIVNASGRLIDERSRCCRPAFSARYISTPTAISIPPITNGLRQVVSACLLKARPAMPTGMLPIASSHSNM